MTFLRDLKARIIADNRGWERIQARARAPYPPQRQNGAAS